MPIDNTDKTDPAATCNIDGPLRKMVIEPGEGEGAPARYSLRFGDRLVALDPLFGKRIRLEFSGTIRCVACNRTTRKSFNQGYCYPCFRSLAACDLCIVRPETCHYHEGTCREPEWATGHCMQPHIVYLAATSTIKVGITRKTQMPTRWLDQGAMQAMPLFEVPTRRDAGLIESALKAHIADRTDWRAMLKGAAGPVDLEAAARDLLESARGSLENLSLIESQAAADGRRRAEDIAKMLHPLASDTLEFSYPLDHPPPSLRSISLDKSPQVEDVLVGSKGQYLVFESGVFNVRRHGGYEVRLAII
ncbi:DUF2797 domain-containing protein [Thioalkalivibrio sp. HK1]|uniref:DUF2797 domain-containing protein n=1 Tax=Thioalkalivibrio sp. HK1 TaxID=1469245 RepID=UPI0004B1C726|nr:DUF2797 domain-containing protein [Thioalkalivibrio sp. HK1]